MTVCQSSLISSTHHCHDWHPVSCCGWTCNQLTSKVDRGLTGQVVNSHLMCDPTIWQPGFDLPRQQWSLLNSFCTKQRHCGACRRKWRLTDTDLCPCGETQTMSHMVASCPWQSWMAAYPRYTLQILADQLRFMIHIREEEDFYNIIIITKSARQTTGSPESQKLHTKVTLKGSSVQTISQR